MLHKDLKKDAINEFGIKYWISNPVWVKFQEHGSSFYLNIEERVWLLEKTLNFSPLIRLLFLCRRDGPPSSKCGSNMVNLWCMVIEKLTYSQKLHVPSIINVWTKNKEPRLYGNKETGLFTIMWHKFNSQYWKWGQDQVTYAWLTCTHHVLVQFTHIIVRNIHIQSNLY